MTRQANGPSTPQFDSARDFHEGLCAVSVDNGASFGYIDKTGKFVIKPQFNEAEPFFEDLAAVEVDKKYGYIDKKGNFFVKPQYRSAYRFIKGVGKVIVWDESGFWEGYILKTGEVFYGEP